MPRRPPSSTAAVALVAFAVILLLGLALLWALTRGAQPGAASPAAPAAGGAAGTGETVAPARVPVPLLVGLPVGAATKALRKLGLNVEVSARTSTEQVGTVVDQHPESGAHVVRGTIARIVVARRAFVSTAVATTTTPAAENTATTTTASASAPAPAPAEPAKVLMPKLVGGSLADAQEQLRRQGLHSRIERVGSSQTAGTVIAQTPVAGAQLRRGMTVTLRVATAPAAVQIPDVTGLEEQDARGQLTAAGFKVESTDESVTDGTQDGIVIAVDPSGRAPKGSTVTITVGRLSEQTAG